MATMDDIAKKAGVSQATVSRVINGNPGVSPELRARVMKWVRELDYQPNATARSLKKSRSRLIGLIITDISNPYFAEVVHAVEDAAHNNGYNVIIGNTDGDIFKEKEHIKNFRSRQVEGILLVPSDRESKHLDTLRNLDIPVVVITQILDKFDSVAVDHRRGGQLIAKHLIDLGHREIGFIGEREDIKFQGFRDYLVELGVDFDENDLVEINGGQPELTSHTAYKSFKLYLEKNKDLKPTAFFAYNDLAAFEAIKALEDFGYEVPGDIAIAGFDNTSLAQVSRPGLTSIAQPTGGIGQIALELLLKRINGEGDNKKQQVLLEPRLVVRDSTIKFKITPSF